MWGHRLGGALRASEDPPKAAFYAGVGRLWLPLRSAFQSKMGANELPLVDERHGGPSSGDPGSLAPGPAPNYPVSVTGTPRRSPRGRRPIGEIAGLPRPSSRPAQAPSLRAGLVVPSASLWPTTACGRR